VIALAVWLGSAGCVQAPSGMTPAPGAAPTAPPIQQVETVNEESAAHNPLVQAAIEDLATRLSLPSEQVEVAEARTVAWPDASLGDPQPEMAYAQVPVEGLLIRLRMGRDLYFYHSGGNVPPFLCEQTSALLSKAEQGQKNFL